MKEYQSVYEYWFGNLEATTLPVDKAKIWFNGGAEIDRHIAHKFSSLLEEAFRGSLAHWQQSARGWLSLIVTLDQFPRNIYRGHSKAFAYDHKACALALQGIDKQIDRQLYAVECQFFYMPLQHAEDLALQRQSVQLYNLLLANAPEQLKQHCRNVLSYAQRHLEIIEKFGRFPHRNNILGRSSTTEELEFLQTPNSSF